MTPHAARASAAGERFRDAGHMAPIARLELGVDLLLELSRENLRRTERLERAAFQEIKIMAQDFSALQAALEKIQSVEQGTKLLIQSMASRIDTLSSQIADPAVAAQIATFAQEFNAAADDLSSAVAANTGSATPAPSPAAAPVVPPAAETLPAVTPVDPPAGS